MRKIVLVLACSASVGCGRRLDMFNTFVGAVETSKKSASEVDVNEYRQNRDLELAPLNRFAMLLLNSQAGRRTSVSALPRTATPIARINILDWAYKGNTTTKKLRIALAWGSPSVSVEYDPQGSPDEDHVRKMSKHLKKEGVNAVWAASLASAKMLVADQERKKKRRISSTAPIVYSGASADAEAALDAGVDAVVLKVQDLGKAEAFGSDRIIWRISNGEEAEQIIQALGSDVVFLVDYESYTADLYHQLSDSDSFLIVGFNSMQVKTEEVELAWDLAHRAGIMAVVFFRACVGDEEDIPYSVWACSEVKSCRSREFSIQCMSKGLSKQGGQFNGALATANDFILSTKKTWKRNMHLKFEKLKPEAEIDEEAARVMDEIRKETA